MTASRLLITLMSLLAVTSCTQGNGAAETQNAGRNVFVVNSPITPHLADVIISSFVRNRSLNTLSIVSAGGDAIAGIRIGTFIAQRKINVSAPGLCASACAQFIFLAGYKKFVGPDTIIVFHSSPTIMKNVIANSVLSGYSPVFSPGSAQELDLYKKLNIKNGIFSFVAEAMTPVCVTERFDVPVNQADHFGVGWSHHGFVPSLEQLKAFNVKNIYGKWIEPAEIPIRLSRPVLGSLFRLLHWQQSFQLYKGHNWRNAMPNPFVRASLVQALAGISFAVCFALIVLVPRSSSRAWVLIVLLIIMWSMLGLLVRCRICGKSLFARDFSRDANSTSNKLFFTLTVVPERICSRCGNFTDQ